MYTQKGVETGMPHHRNQPGDSVNPKEPKPMMFLHDVQTPSASTPHPLAQSAEHSPLQVVIHLFHLGSDLAT